MKALLILAIFRSIFFLHPIKMSFSNMSVNDIGEVHIETRFFRDDLKLHIENKYRLRNADFSSLTANGTKALQAYINENLVIIQQNNIIHFSLANISLSEDSLALVVEMNGDAHLNDGMSFKVRNSLLFDVFKKQKNLLTIKDDEYYKFYFTLDNPEQVVD